MLARPTKAEAQILIQQFASEYIENLGRERNSPRLKTVFHELQTLGATAKELRIKIDQLSSEARLALVPGWTYLNKHGRTFHESFLRAFEDSEAATVLREWRTGSRRNWNNQLLALERLADLASRSLVRRYGSGRTGQPDSGGNTNIQKRMYGSAKRILVIDCWQLFEACRPGEATGTIESKDESKTAFYRFVCKVYEFATGEMDPDLDGTSLTRLVTEVAGYQRKFNDLADHRDDVREEIAQLLSARRPKSPDSPADSKVLKRLIDEERTLARDLQHLLRRRTGKKTRRRRNAKQRPIYKPNLS